MATKSASPKKKAPRQTKPKKGDKNQPTLERARIGDITHEERLAQIEHQAKVVNETERLRKEASEERAQAQARERMAKEKWQKEYDRLLELIGDDPALFKKIQNDDGSVTETPAESTPVAPPTPDGEPVSVSELGLPGPIQQKIMEHHHDGAKITTLQRLRKFFDDGCILTDIKGMGPKMAEVVTEKLREYAERTTSDPSATTTDTPAADSATASA